MSVVAVAVGVIGPGVAQFLLRGAVGEQTLDLLLNSGAGYRMSLSDCGTAAL